MHGLRMRGLLPGVLLVRRLDLIAPFAEFVVGFQVFCDLKLCKTVRGPGVPPVRGGAREESERRTDARGDGATVRP